MNQEWVSHPSVKGVLTGFPEKEAVGYDYDHTSEMQMHLKYRWTAPVTILLATKERTSSESRSH